MLIVARDRVRKLKTEGKSAGEIAASKPFADLEAPWGKGFFTAMFFCADGVFDALSRDAQRRKRHSRSAVRRPSLIQVRLL